MKTSRDAVLAAVDGLKPFLRDLPGFRTVREIVEAQCKPGQHPTQTGNWDLEVIPLLADLYLCRDGTLVRVHERPDPMYPAFSVKPLSESDWEQVVQATDGVMGALLAAGVRCQQRARDLPAEIERWLAGVYATAA